MLMLTNEPGLRIKHLEEEFPSSSKFLPANMTSSGPLLEFSGADETYDVATRVEEGIAISVYADRT
jgi:hypothetical protein